MNYISVSYLTAPNPKPPIKDGSKIHPLDGF